MVEHHFGYLRLVFSVEQSQKEEDLFLDNEKASKAVENAAGTALKITLGRETDNPAIISTRRE